MPEKWSALAGVRFLLASIVAVNHIRDYAPLGWLGFIPKFGAFESILGFLLISGYSIGHSYQSQPEGFLWRRIRRLYPVYFAALVLTYVALQVENPAVLTDWFALGLNALFLNQLFTTTSYLGPAWSLSLEFWLYSLAPLLMGLALSRVRLLAYVSFGSYLLYAVARPVLKLPYFASVGFGGNLLLLSFTWVIGLHLSRSKGGEREVMRDVGLMFGVHILLSAAIQLAYRVKHQALLEYMRHDLVGYFMQGLTLVFVWLVFQQLVVASTASTRRSWLLRFLGDVSYPLYLLHVPLCILLAKAGLRSALLFYLISIACSALVYQLLDTYSKRRHLGGRETTA